MEKKILEDIGLFLIGEIFSFIATIRHVRAVSEDYSPNFMPFKRDSFFNGVNTFHGIKKEEGTHFNSLK